MKSPAAKLESNGDEVVDDSLESEKITSSARLRIAELLQTPFDLPSISQIGLFMLAVFYALTTVNEEADTDKKQTKLATSVISVAADRYG